VPAGAGRKWARDVIPEELRKAGAEVDVVEAYENGLYRNNKSRVRPGAT